MLARDSWRAEPSIFPRRSGRGGRRGRQEPCRGPSRSAGFPETPETAEQPPATPVSRPLTMPEPSAHNEPADVGIGEAATTFFSTRIASADDRSRALRYNGSESTGRARLGTGEGHHRGPPGQAGRNRAGRTGGHPPLHRDGSLGPGGRLSGSVRT